MNAARSPAALADPLRADDGLQAIRQPGALVQQGPFCISRQEEGEALSLPKKEGAVRGAAGHRSTQKGGTTPSSRPQADTRAASSRPPEADKSIAARHELDGGKFLEVGMVGHEVQSPLWGEISRAQGLPEPCPAEPFHRWGGGGAMLEPAQRPARVVEAEVLEGKLLILACSSHGTKAVRHQEDSRDVVPHRHLSNRRHDFVKPLVAPSTPPEPDPLLVCFCTRPALWDEGAQRPGAPHPHPVLEEVEEQLGRPGRAPEAIQQLCVVPVRAEASEPHREAVIRHVHGWGEHLKRRVSEVEHPALRGIDGPARRCWLKQACHLCRGTAESAVSGWCSDSLGEELEALSSTHRLG
eukprot:CAMPEP_0177579680 /NCGR_PEP_ID=MMETSP0419_2-20121207/1099_1 /TAXON_ID=582737 /ORGANISM="Tetraselmis sp., Strain GSL018" /LENGTH=353 /DNA_ID=CAMNT_0019068383 /DNA_START=124 /DNA_END=1185 /DNA_ORIENTATION=-